MPEGRHPVTNVGASAPPAAMTVEAGLEARGRWWLIVSFLACPCHLPLTLGLLGAVLGGTALGVVLREHALLAGAIVASAWLAGTARGLLLIRRADQGRLACGLPRQKGPIFRRRTAASE